MEIEKQAKELVETIQKANSLITLLHSQGVEIRMTWKDADSKGPPNISLWRVTQSVDYLK